MSIRRAEVTDTIGTLYFGGGTPSLLSPQEIGRIIEQVYRLFSFSSDAEITLEANPDDLNTSYVQELRTLPINRISMGAQSFHDEDLHFLNRRHNARQVLEAVDTCRNAGLTNLSIDLIYGLPGQTPARWQENISAVLALSPPHLSAYHLIYEEGTPLTRLLHAGKVREVDEEVSLELFRMLREQLTGRDFQFCPFRLSLLPQQLLLAGYSLSGSWPIGTQFRWTAYKAIQSLRYTPIHSLHGSRKTSLHGRNPDR